MPALSAMPKPPNPIRPATQRLPHPNLSASRLADPQNRLPLSQRHVATSHPSHKLGIFFPVESGIPQLIWYESERKLDVWGVPVDGGPVEEEEERAKFDIANLGSVMGDDKPPVQYMPFQINPVKRFPYPQSGFPGVAWHRWIET